MKRQPSASFTSRGSTLVWLTKVLCVLGLCAEATTGRDAAKVTLGGEVGKAAAAASARFQSAPFDSLPWLRADLTGEKVSEFDDVYRHPLCRPYKQYSGDISGRFLEIMALNSTGDPAVHPAFKDLLAEVPEHQRPGGYFCASGEIDWQQPLDAKDKDSPAMKVVLPALWGNARMLCGLVEVMRAFPEEAATARSAVKLGDFYLSVLPRFTNPERMKEYERSGSYAAGYVTCWFPVMEGLVRLSRTTGEAKYLEGAKTIAEFYQRFDTIPIDHAHGMLCCQVALLDLYEETHDASYLDRVEKRWEELVRDGYINPAGGILEKCRVSYKRRLCDEGCALADWLRLNLALGRITGKTRYWAMAERTLQNHYLQNQSSQGGFGHRGALADDEGVTGLGKSNLESTWCCTYHGELGFIELRRHLLMRADEVLTVPLVLDFTVEDPSGTVTSVLKDGPEPGTVIRQRLSLTGQPSRVLRVRLPHWADGVTARSGGGEAVALEIRDGWCTTTRPVSEIEFDYLGGLYGEDRRCKRLPGGPEPGKPFVIGYGPRLLAFKGKAAPRPAWPTTLEELASQGITPLSPVHHKKDCSYVMPADESAP
ncbi:beta-L-arabinofuranosidase domain-containing protein [Haloferula sp. A504]|uniref:beta-L-arabinofuranosidase domain-containing protein n=1 Tax=Haloferula sp. A504 TaxID=3373601 RepID=UPI0031C09DA4|nr:glycoside hydrolase family 127 protein [Verrucomicrobiaceae bacterium E54]